ncbi:hypothetical protein JXB01_00600 [Candidatus Micrarchaeota archaeon]|nr:hypothetical protein [Candidatus Micrarchaeota archaeon]
MGARQKPEIISGSIVYDIETKVGKNDVLIRLRNPPEIYRRKGEKDSEFYSRLIKTRPEAAVFVRGKLASLMDRYKISENLVKTKKLSAKTKEEIIVKNVITRRKKSSKIKVSSRPRKKISRKTSKKRGKK